MNDLETQLNDLRLDVGELKVRIVQLEKAVDAMWNRDEGKDAETSS